LKTTHSVIEGRSGREQNALSFLACWNAPTVTAMMIATIAAASPKVLERPAQQPFRRVDVGARETSPFGESCAGLELKAA
jgi:hypothetical protein